VVGEVDAYLLLHAKLLECGRAGDANQAGWTAAARRASSGLRHLARMRSGRGRANWRSIFASYFGTASMNLNQILRIRTGRQGRLSDFASLRSAARSGGIRMSPSRLARGSGHGGPRAFPRSNWPRWFAPDGSAATTATRSFARRRASRVRERSILPRACRWSAAEPAHPVQRPALRQRAHIAASLPTLITACSISLDHGLL
jgi:hypothetical protein